MPRQPAPRRLVIDADVARATGRSSSQDPTSTACRAFLACLHDETRHLMAASEELGREWDEHASPFAIRWRALMRSRRRLVDVGPVRDPELRRALAQHAATDTQRERVLKDAHLVETARCADRVVCSRDERVRTDLRRLSGAVTQLARVAWVNPVRPDEQALAWLRSGAPGDDRRLLSHDGAD